MSISSRGTRKEGESIEREHQGPEKLNRHTQVYIEYNIKKTQVCYKGQPNGYMQQLYYVVSLMDARKESV